MFDFSEDPLVRDYLAKLAASPQGYPDMMEEEERETQSSSNADEAADDFSEESQKSAGNASSRRSRSSTSTPTPAEDAHEIVTAEASTSNKHKTPDDDNDDDLTNDPAASRSSNSKRLLKGVNKEYGADILNTIIDNTRTRLADIEGNAAAKAALEESVVLPALNPTLFTGLRAPCKGILLFGPPGNGKTMLAKAVANECNSTFFNISAATIMSKWVGEGERLVKALFQVARNAQPSIIFIDEIDSMLCKRSEQEDGSERRVKTEFLVQLDGCSSGKCADDRVLVLGATNRPHELDEGILRRFPQRIFIDLPDQAARATMIRRTFELHNTKMSMSDEELDQIAAQTSNYSYSDLMALCRAAALIPIQSVSKKELRRCSADQLRPVDLHDLESAARAVRPSVNAESRQKLFKFAKSHAQMS